jgi:hypothetical protein
LIKRITKRRLNALEAIELAQMDDETREGNAADDGNVNHDDGAIESRNVEEGREEAIYDVSSRVIQTRQKSERIKKPINRWAY